jgi:hypothetical protein
MVQIRLYGGKHQGDIVETVFSFIFTYDISFSKHYVNASEAVLYPGMKFQAQVRWFDRCVSG